MTMSMITIVYSRVVLKNLFSRHLLQDDLSKIKLVVADRCLPILTDLIKRPFAFQRNNCLVDFIE